MTRRGGRRRSRGVAVVAVAATLAAVLAACGAPDRRGDGPVTLSWWTPSDRVQVEKLADACSAASGDEYEIEVRRLPEDPQQRHDDLLRRLSAQDDSIDLVTVDIGDTTELAGAGLLAPLPRAQREEFAQDLFPVAERAATVAGELVAVPWWIDVDLLWFRGLSAERAGLDVTKAVTWDDLAAGAARLGGTVGILDADGRGTARWVDALVAGSGGRLVSGPSDRPRTALSGPAGARAAEVVEQYAAAGGRGPSEDAVDRFVRNPGSFVVAPVALVSDPLVAQVGADLGWAPYPVVDAEAAAPVSGANLAVPLYARHTPESYDAISCLTGENPTLQVMLTTGHAAPRTTVFDSETARSGYPMAAVVKKALETGVVPPATPYWDRIAQVLDDTWSPASDVDAATPRRSAAEIRDAAQGRLP